ncbi:MAG: hypothetical protein PVI33_03760 [Candidatus Omnitrophota bacterium]|jgi:tetratricopeptide (TPR) repeat protein
MKTKAAGTKKFIISLALVLLIAYAAVMTGATVYFINQIGTSKQKILSLELLRHEMEKQIEDVSQEITVIEQQRQELQETFDKLENDSQKKSVELSTQVENYKGKVQELQGKLTNAERQLATLREDNRKLQTAAQSKAGDKATKLDSQLAEKETELTRLNQTVKDLEEEVKLKESTIHYNLAVNFFDRQDFDNSVIEYEKALEANPEHCPSHYNLGILYEEYKSDYPKAIYHYRKYLILCPDAEDADQVKQWISDLESRTSSTTAN